MKGKVTRPMWAPLLACLTALGGAVGCETPEDVQIELNEQDDADGDGYKSDDCDDAAPLVNPGASEVANGHDDDCDGVIDEGTAAADDDGDGYSEDQGDADDSDPSTYPGATELPDSLDNDQDGNVDEGTELVDDDGDGYSEADGDRNDGDPGTYPGATEVADGEDNDCDGTVDEHTSAYDDDSDGYSEDQGDCDDGDPPSAPRKPEQPDGSDNDCDGKADEGTANYDDDGDSYSEAEGDCNDSRSTVHPGAIETAGGKPDGVDNDCDGKIDEGTTVADDDGDGFSPSIGDCDDNDPDRNPGAPEVLNDIDDDCDGEVDEGTAAYDDDGDGLAEADGDCDDANPDINPSAFDVCNGVDDDCNGVIDEPCSSCQVPETFASLELALAAACGEVVLPSTLDEPLVIVDPPYSVRVLAAGGHGAVPGLSVVLTPQGAGRDIEVQGFSFTGVGAVSNTDSQSSVTLTELTFKDLNTSRGALTVTGSNVTVQDSLFEDNEASDRSDTAGALNISGRSFTLRRNTFRDNKVDSPVDDAGGAVIIAGSSTSGRIENCLFEGNRADESNAGGAIFIDQDVQSAMLLLNNTFVDNRNETNADASDLRCQGGLPGGIVSSSIFWGAPSRHISGCASLAVSYSTFEGDSHTGAGNSTADPRFDEQDEHGYSLSAGSPCINAGDPAASRNDTDGSRNDMGHTGGPEAR